VFLNFVEATPRADEVETRRTLGDKWRALPESLRTSRQLYGSHDEGCGATVGVMPRCDFACSGCYLGPDANSIPAESVAAVKSQIRALKPYLGRWGNLQLTDGEVTLLPEPELIEILRYARELELVPMMMTHGDTFLRKPGLLTRLMVEGGLQEISIHIDTTQKGRRDRRFNEATCEADLNPLREKFADMIRDARRETGLPLRAASTVTVSADNLDEVPGLVDWFLRHSDAFRLVSFLPLAKVGRTSDALGGVDVDELWNRIGRGLPDRPAIEALKSRQWWLGHSGCNRIMLGMAHGNGRGGTGYQAFSPADADDQQIYRQFCERLGGLTLRGRTVAQAVRTLLLYAWREPGFFFIRVPRYVWSWLTRAGEGHPFRAFRRFATGRDRLDVFTVVSHHFMDRSELETDRGRERVEHCVFRVPVNGELVSMCEFNAGGGRDRYYANLKKARNHPASPVSRRS
jgi:molybdenum cofactor biosynthesis enzyme MoaA